MGNNESLDIKFEYHDKYIRRCYSVTIKGNYTSLGYLSEEESKGKIIEYLKDKYNYNINISDISFTKKTFLNMETSKSKKSFENGTNDLVLCFYHNSDYDEHERGYKSELWFEDGKGNKINYPDFIIKEGSKILDMNIHLYTDLHTYSDEIIQIIKDEGYMDKEHILYSKNDAWYIGFTK